MTADPAACEGSLAEEGPIGLAENDPAIGQAFTDYSKTRGGKLIVVPSAVEAVARFGSQLKVRALVFDNRLEEGPMQVLTESSRRKKAPSGAAAALVIRRRRPNLPISVYSGYPISEVRKARLRHHGIDVFKKPLPAKQLEAIFRNGSGSEYQKQTAPVADTVTAWKQATSRHPDQQTQARMYITMIFAALLSLFGALALLFPLPAPWNILAGISAISGPILVLECVLLWLVKSQGEKAEQ